MVGEKYGQNDIYHMLIATVPDLASVVNKKAVIKEKIAENTTMITALDAEYARQTAAFIAEGLRQTAALTAKDLKLNQELVSIESEEKNQSVLVDGKTNLCGRKRSHRSEC